MTKLATDSAIAEANRRRPPLGLAKHHRGHHYFDGPQLSGYVTSFKIMDLCRDNRFRHDDA
jgi:hypothetical protein